LFDWLQRNQWVYILVFGAAIILLWRSLKSGDEVSSNSDVISDECWYYDVETGDSFRAKRELVAPIKSPKGNEAVWASMYGCGGCGPSQRFAGFYVKHTDDMKKRADADPAVRARLFGERAEGRLYSTDGKSWIAAASPGEAGVLDSFRTRCGELDLKRCP